MRIVSRILFGIIVIAAVAGVWWLTAVSASRSTPSSPNSASQPSPATQSTTASAVPSPAKQAPSTSPTPTNPATTSIGQGTATVSAVPQTTDPAAGVPADANPQVRSVVEAVRSGKHPERLSIAVDPAPFDPAAFARDPQAYLQVVEPARVYQTAAAGPTAVPLVATIDHTVRISARGSTPLSVVGKPGAPVSFTILDGGQFENGLTSITVLAGDDGKATATYSATPGTVDEVQILAGSPMTVGTLTLTVHVADPAATVSAR